MSEPAKLPDFLRKSVPRLLPGVQIGETVWVNFTEMEVDEEGRCFLNPGATASERALAASVMVERRGDGYHVTIPQSLARLARWEPGRHATKGHYPVASLTIEKADA